MTISDQVMKAIMHRGLLAIHFPTKQPSTGGNLRQLDSASL